MHLIVKGTGAAALAAAKACVARYAGSAPSVYCFAFPSERAFRYAQVSRRPGETMRRPCWSAYWGKPSGRRPFGSGSNPAGVALRCPDATG